MAQEQKTNWEVIHEESPLKEAYDKAREQMKQEQVVDYLMGEPLPEDIPQNEHEPQETTKELTIFIPLNATIEERLMFMSYLGDSEPLWSYPGETLTIVGVAAFDDWKRNKDGVELLDEDGALIPCKRTIWKHQSGKLFHSTSNVAYGWCKKSLWPVMTYDNKPGDLVAPVKIKIGLRPTRSGNNTFKFDIVSE